jgi:hypothetical protein
VLDLQGSTFGLDDAIANLVAWTDLAADQLTEDDMADLSEIGGLVYREGLRRRQGGEQA